MQEDALTPAETAAALEASRRVHSDLDLIRAHQVPAPEPLPTRVTDEWRQLGCMYEHDPAFEALLDHPSVFEKIEPLLGEHFIVHSSWCTMVPAGHEGGGFHQDASGPSQFRRLSASGVAPLVQVRVGFVLTDLSESDCGNLVVVPGSHHAEVALPAAGQEDESLISCAVQLRAKAGSAGGLRKKQPETSLSDPRSAVGQCSSTRGSGTRAGATRAHSAGSCSTRSTRPPGCVAPTGWPTPMRFSRIRRREDDSSWASLRRSTSTS